jgi:PST family polysaccharide transporter
MQDSLKNKVLSASKWSALGEGVSRALQPLSYVVLARLLGPTEYGTVAIAAIVISFSQIFSAGTFSKVLVQRQHADIAPYANVAFWCNLVVSGFCYLIIFLSADLLAVWFSVPESALVIRVQSLQILIVNFSTVQRTLLQRELDFKPIFKIRLLVALIPFLITIPLAWQGFSYWSLVIAVLASSIIEAIYFWIKISWKPQLQFSMEKMRSMWNFGIWIIAENLLTWAIVWIDSIIVGKWLTTLELGQMRSATALVSAAFGLTLSPILPILFSSFSKVQNDTARLLVIYKKTTEAISFVAIALTMFVVAFQDLIVVIVYGDKWGDIGYVISMLFMLNGFAWLVGANSELYRATNKPDINVKIAAIALVYYIPCFLVSIQYGFNEFLVTRLLVSIIAIPIHMYAVYRVINSSFKKQLNYMLFPVLSSLPLLAFCKIHSPFQINDILNLSNILCLFLLFFGISILTYRNRLFVLELKQMIIKKIGR